MSFAPIVLTIHDHTVSSDWKLLFYYYNYWFCCLLWIESLSLSRFAHSLSGGILPRSRLLIHCSARYIAVCALFLLIRLHDLAIVVVVVVVSLSVGLTLWLRFYLYFILSEWTKKHIITICWLHLCVAHLSSRVISVSKKKIFFVHKCC